MSRIHYLIASLVAPLAALLVPIGLALFELHAEPPILPDGSADDAGMRGAGVFLAIVLPICYPLACIYYAAVGKILARIKRFTFKATFSFAAAAPWLLVAIALPGFVGNTPDIVLSLSLLGIIGISMSLFAMLVVRVKNLWVKCGRQSRRYCVKNARKASALLRFSPCLGTISPHLPSTNFQLTPLGAFLWWIIATGKVSSNSILPADAPRR